MRRAGAAHSRDGLRLVADRLDAQRFVARLVATVSIARWLFRVAYLVNVHFELEHLALFVVVRLLQLLLLVLSVLNERLEARVAARRLIGRIVVLVDVVFYDIGTADVSTSTQRLALRLVRRRVVEQQVVIVRCGRIDRLRLVLVI